MTPFVLLFSPIFYLVARTGIGTEICRKLKFYPMRIHFYQPIPDYKFFWDSSFSAKRILPGFSINQSKVRETLKKLSGYSDECSWPENKVAGQAYYTQNTNFAFSSAALLHTMIRAHKTKRIVEVGSGFSTMIMLKALEKNWSADFHLTCIEPYPLKWLREEIEIYPCQVELLSIKAQNANLDIYFQLEENDILFIDSSHVSKFGSDVNYLYLQVLPQLAKGTLIHLHDIYTPYDYPKAQFEGRIKFFWNEQYLLEAFLTNNHDFEIILPGYYVQTEFEDEFNATFSNYNSAIHRATSSFWLRKLT